MTEKIKSSLEFLEERLQEIISPPEDENKATVDGVIETGINAIADTIKIIPGASFILAIPEAFRRREKEIRKKKELYLLSECYRKTEAAEKNVDDLKNNLEIFVENFYGHLLYAKINSMLQLPDTDCDVIDQLSNCLIKIINSDYKTLFDTHRFVLSFLERLPTPAIKILRDCENIKPIRMVSPVYGERTISQKDIDALVNNFIEQKEIKDSTAKHQVSSWINTLANENLIILDQGNLDDRSNRIKCLPTDTGQLIIEYISDRISQSNEYQKGQRLTGLF